MELKFIIITLSYSGLLTILITIRVLFSTAPSSLEGNLATSGVFSVSELYRCSQSKFGKKFK